MATLEELINRMYDMVQDAKGIPLAGEKCIVERDHMLDMLDELREALPNDLQQAQEIVAKRSEMLASGKREAEAIRRQAEEDARQMVSETEIVVAARRKAKEVQATPRFRLVSCAAWQMSTARIPSSVPRRQWLSVWRRSARHASASRASQSKTEMQAVTFGWLLFRVLCGTGTTGILRSLSRHRVTGRHELRERVRF
ncbi:hypothetical protein [Butyricicoccus sp. OF10-2]|uniref:hypothetical protein n=1 Tax=Butyricicoccus sp. OF10-2 TaxID=2292298 RepID=UPI001FA983DF|nr:hypothetical protein [Butyricicoccus sp. OF10-2]